MTPAAATYLRAAFQPAWSRTLLRVLVSYPEVRFVLPDRVGLEAAADARLIDTLMRFVGRQSWLVTGVTVG